MSESEEKIQISKATLEKLFSLAKMDIPAAIDDKAVNEAIGKIQSAPQVENSSAPAGTTTDGTTNAFLEGGVESSRPRTVLIVDDLGVVVYQLQLQFKKKGFEVATANNINDCIALFKKKDYGYVIMDLFLPTEREGFMLLDALKKLVLLCKLDTKIIVMTASNKPEHKATCKNKGADFFLEKNQGWQNELAKYCT